jgi:putative oxidoreductase
LANLVIRYALGNRALQLTAAGQLAPMSGVRSFARPMLASIFVAQGLQTLQHPELVADRAEPVVKRMADLIPALPGESEQAVRVNGAIQVTAGTLLGLGWFPRLSALALAGTLVPTTIAGHPYWTEKDPAARQLQRIHFLKNVSMLGGLLLAAVDTDGNPSLAWRRRRAARAAAALSIGPAAQAVAGSARAAGDELGRVALTVAESAKDAISAELPRIIQAARIASDRVSAAAQTAADSASEQLPKITQAVTDSARSAASQVSQAAAASRERARQYAAT